MILDFTFVHTVTVEPFLGVKNGHADYGTGQAVACWVEDENRLVRNADGEEVVSSTRVRAPIDKAALFPPRSRVTTSTRTAFVIALHLHDSGMVALGLDHIQVDLT